MRKIICALFHKHKPIASLNLFGLAHIALCQRCNKVLWIDGAIGRVKSRKKGKWFVIRGSLQNIAQSPEDSMTLKWEE